MAPPRNLRRRQALADAAIEILGASGLHELSHRTVDERAGLPSGTTSNYFRSRDDLLDAVARRVVELHLADMAAAQAQVTGVIDRDGLAEMIGASLHDAATRHRRRFLAIYELSLEATRRPELAQVMSEIAIARLAFTVGQHRALGLGTSPGQVQALMTLFGGALLALVTGPPEAVTPEATLTLARCMVAGLLGSMG